MQPPPRRSRRTRATPGNSDCGGARPGQDDRPTMMMDRSCSLPCGFDAPSGSPSAGLRMIAHILVAVDAADVETPTPWWHQLAPRLRRRGTGDRQASSSISPSCIELNGSGTVSTTTQPSARSSTLRSGGSCCWSRSWSEPGRLSDRRQREHNPYADKPKDATLAADAEQGPGYVRRRSCSVQALPTWQRSTRSTSRT